MGNRLIRKMKTKEEEEEKVAVVVAEAKAIVSEEEMSKMKSTPSAKVIGLMDPESDIPRVLHVGKHLSWKEIEQLLISTTAPITLRYRALTLAFSKKPSPEELVRVMERALKVQTESLLLRHEIAYMLGQAGNRRAMNLLRDLLYDEREDEVVRHEAAEALWAITCLSDGKFEALEDITKFASHSSLPLAQTCQLVLEGVRAELESDEEGEEDHAEKGGRPSKIPPICACQSKPIGNEKNKYATFDPASAIPGATRAMIPSLGKQLRNASNSMLSRYVSFLVLARTLFASSAAAVSSLPSDCTHEQISCHVYVAQLGRHRSC